ncbi:hypothetical protein RHGRI_017117 [Rhododendron griersonianum]|uniref:PHD finger family protein n=1 Tax=Rhododendron griersonianum TaxID=479676 RepID=A0AAV6JWR0_9ERIC|nr:hypothetical protein RHGRI_017117 [Rhododendron griersonianum]
MQRWWWWQAMTGGRCHRRRKMMGRGADGGCGTEEKPCPISRVPSKIPSKESDNFEEQTTTALDFYTQARKALCQRSPFDAEDAQVSSSSTVFTLPSGLASCFLSRHLDGRKRHKKSHSSGVEAKSSGAAGGGVEKPNKLNIWVETEEYFRELKVDDIDKLHEFWSLVFSDSHKSFSIPVIGNVVVVNEVNGVNANAVGIDCGVVVKEEEEVVVKEEKEEEEVEHFMEVDSVGADILLQEEKGCSSSLQCSSGVEWLLGSKSKIHLTSERPSKKRKLLGGDAGLEKLLVACPVDGLSSLCHYCSLGDTGNQLNRLIVCSACNAAVHQRCYGVQDDVAASWLCSWCKQRNAVQSSDRPCLLCPKPGGALKPVGKRGVGNESGGCMEFAHLFCCQWMPEVYIQDMRLMEPVMNIEEIKLTRKKLICYLCKVKCGTCIRCSNGTCRTSFHPICAREARHRMEIWGKLGCDDVELRAFCSKHSEVQNGCSTQQSGDMSMTVASDSTITKDQLVTPTVNKPHKFKVGRKNGDKISVQIEATDLDVKKLGNAMLHGGLSDARSNSMLQPGCGNAQQPASTETLGRSLSDDVITSDSLDFTVILKKLIDRRKVNMKDVASEIGVPPDSLASMLADNCVVPDLRSKIVTWLKKHAYIGNLKKNLKVKIKSSFASKDGMGAAEGSDAVLVSESDNPEVVPVKSVPPRRRTKSNIRILKENKVICSSREKISDEEIIVDEADRGHLISEDASYTTKEVVFDVTKENLDHEVVHDSLDNSSPTHEGGRGQWDAISEQNVTSNSDPDNTLCSGVKNNIRDPIKAEAVFSSYIHPLVRNKIMIVQNAVLSSNAESECHGSMDQEFSSLEASSSSGICDQHIERLDSCDISEFDGGKLEQLAKARNMGVLEMNPEDEVEGEIIFHQHRLLCNLVGRKSISDDLICKVAKGLPQEIDAIAKQKWDAVLVNQYLSELREAKKRGRKERRHKEAQAVLAAATAAAAASLRISSQRKDAPDEENLLKVNHSTGRPGLYSQQMPRAKETLSKLAVPRVSSQIKSDFGAISGFSKEHPRTCDICRRSETFLNQIVVCSSCKVAIHLDCYRSVKDSTGPWYCELCEDLLSSRSSGAPAMNSWEKPFFSPECGLCGGSAGAFRKSTDSQWVHAFCAEWVLEATFRRGQVNPVEGMESVLKGSDVCYICHRKQGVCIKCNYGHCQSTFHPTCARTASCYMNMKTSGSKLQHKAYCEKHSSEQRAKAETQGHGVEELKSLKKIRVELERLRLLCERIIKREKVKRELVFCSHEELVAKRDAVALSALVRTPFFPTEVSSESATTSLKGSGSEAIHRSDDITIDSTVSGKRRIKIPMSMDSDQKTDDSSTSQNLFMQKPRERVSFAGKQIPHRPSFVASENLLDDGEKKSNGRKHTETFEKELVMTSDQASVKNQRLPKGFVYVPIRCLSKEKESDPDSYSGKPLERNG